ncbi:ribosomal protein L18e/L15P [Kalaharituber pfeilii]|nr:ribosomal protein L18e/L15P [Kalaharituber pfeilii]
MLLRPSLVSSGIHATARRALAACGPSPPTMVKCAFSTSPLRQASILGELHNFKASYSKVIRRGRGPSSGKGSRATWWCTRGFNGGQTKDEIVAGSFGFKNRNSVIMSPLSLDHLQEWIDAGRIDPNQPITFKELVRSRCLHGIKDGVKLLGGKGKGNFRARINITVSRASKSAIEAVEAAGGTVTTRFFNRLGILTAAYPQCFPHAPRLADPTSRKDIEYYRDPDHRGYLAHTVKPDENPHSLFFKKPEEADKVKQRKKKQSGKQKKQAENRLW